MVPITARVRLFCTDRGAALVEFALVLPLLLVIIGGIVDFGFLFQRYEVVTNAAREGARLASLPGYPCSPGGVVEARVREYIKAGLSMTDAQVLTVVPSGNIGITCPDLTVPLGGGGSATIPTARVVVTYQHQFLLLGPVMGLIGSSWGSSINIVSTSQMRLEVPASGS